MVKKEALPMPINTIASKESVVSNVILAISNALYEAIYKKLGSTVITPLGATTIFEIWCRVMANESLGIKKFILFTLAGSIAASINNIIKHIDHSNSPYRNNPNPVWVIKDDKITSSNPALSKIIKELNLKIWDNISNTIFEAISEQALDNNSGSIDCKAWRYSYIFNFKKSPGLILKWYLKKYKYIPKYLINKLAWAINIYWTDISDKIKLIETLSKFVSPSVLQAIKNWTFKEQFVKTQATTLFSDIRWFTNLSEKVDWTKMMQFLTVYFALVTKIVYDHWWHIDKFNWDWAMIVFPEKWWSESAIRASIEINKMVEEYQEEFQILLWLDDNQYNGIKIWIWLNTWEVNMWPIWWLFKDITVLWSSVNEAARIEPLTKITWFPLLISDKTLNSLSDTFKSSLNLIYLWRHKGKWVSKPLTLYGISDTLTDDRKKLWNNILNTFNKWIRFMESSNFKFALVYFNKISTYNEPCINLLIKFCKSKIK